MEFIERFGEMLPKIRPRPSLHTFRIILSSLLHSLATTRDNPRIVAVLPTIIAGADDECCSELMQGLAVELQSTDPVRAIVALRTVQGLMNKVPARRLIQLFSSSNFHVLPQLSTLILRQHSTGPAALETVTVAVDLLSDILSRDRTFRLTPRHMSVVLLTAAHCLEAFFPLHTPTSNTDYAEVYDGVAGLILAMAAHRAPQCHSCQPSMSGCLRWLMLALPTHKLPATCARQLSRLLETVAADAQASFKKHAAYFVSDYIQKFHTFTVGETVLRELKPGVFAMLAACEDEERKLIHNAANAAGKSYFKQLIVDYNQDYKYKGGS
eukprot:TRINITY_DN52271_c0_g1_i1.p1 TRINITY_DN52271_c0_g1~~TRINITY_DN52271_c0_g1_i1.p1  ORF type:complete len:325 (-),score=66.95 TRINITY_DN52271_c0_g1_i1:133-1107(-)